jgi:hypothetical protein
MEKGKIRTLNRYKQLMNYVGLDLPGNITPMDIEGTIEINNLLFGFYEFKLKGIECPYGQKLWYEHMIQTIYQAGKIGYVLIIEHETPAEEEVISRDLPVTKVYWTGNMKWRTPKNKTTFNEAIKAFHQIYMEKYCKSELDRVKNIKEFLNRKK